MSKVSRADWAASVPWKGITDKPDSFGVTDIGELTGNGFGDDNVPVYDAATGRFRPGSRFPTPDPEPEPPTPGPALEITVSLDFPSLHALQTAYEDVDFVGTLPSEVVVVGSSFDNEFIQISATVPLANKARITVTNMGLADVDLSDGFFRLRRFNG